MKILVATRNPGKFHEFSKCLCRWKLNPINLDDIGIEAAIEETGKTFEENALLKSMYYCQKTNLTTIADDNGLEIDALGGAPGVKNGRWKGFKMTNQEMIDYTLKILADVPKKDRTCRLVTAISLITPKPDFREFTSLSFLEGEITKKQMLPIEPGFPFKSIFYVSKFKKMLGELTAAEHRKIDHRLKAINKLKCHLCK